MVRTHVVAASSPRVDLAIAIPRRPRHRPRSPRARGGRARERERRREGRRASTTARSERDRHQLRRRSAHESPAKKSSRERVRARRREHACLVFPPRSLLRAPLSLLDADNGSGAPERVEVGFRVLSRAALLGPAQPLGKTSVESTTVRAGSTVSFLADLAK